MEFDPANLDTQGEFYYDFNKRRVLLYSVLNPAIYYSDIECALHRHMISITSSSYIKLENLNLRYGGSHGIWVNNSDHVVITDNEMSYIGGAIQNPYVSNVRYGNGIELWDSGDHIYVERNKIQGIYDAGLTTQGSNANTKSNQYFRHNIVWNSHYCFEYWNHPSRSNTYEIHFENNTCAYNGIDLMFFSNTAITHNFYIKNNIFYEASDHSFILIDNPWTGLENLDIDYNLWYKEGGVTILYPPCSTDIYSSLTNHDSVFRVNYGYIAPHCISCTIYSFAQYKNISGKDQNSVEADPLFTDAMNNDFHPQVGSVACSMSYTGSYVGALPCMVYTITVIKSGTGSGMVTSDDGGISCGSDCSETYDEGTEVILTATPATGSIFSGWSNDCSACGANSTCNITIDSDKSCEVIFIPSEPLPDIKANGSDGPVTLSRGNPLSVTIELNCEGYCGNDADWWAVVDTPLGWYYFDIESNSWKPDFSCSYQGPLVNMEPYEVLNVIAGPQLLISSSTSTLPIGIYTFYFGVDMNVDCLLNKQYYDYVEVDIVP
jgi:hypothetical protein